MLPKPTQETAWKPIYIGGICSFIQTVQFAIFFPSMWPYILTLQPDLKQSSFGIVVAAYSFTQCIFSPFFGYWSNNISQVRLPMIIGFIIMAFGNLVYLSLQFWNDHYLYVMMFSRLIAGAGSGNMSLLRAYASTASTSKDRSKAIVCVSGGIAIGSMVGPALQLLFTPLGAEGITTLGLKIDIYTAPALLCLVINTIGLLIVQLAFVEKQIILDSADSSAEEDVPKKKLINPCMIAISVCIMTRFTQQFINTTVESIDVAFTMMMFSFEKEKAVAMNATMHTIFGAIASVLYLSFIFTGIRKYDLVIPLVWMLSTYPYNFYKDNVKPMINVVFEGSDANCDFTKYTWCEDLTTVPIWAYYAGFIMMFGVSFSIINITNTTLYSKVVGPRPQGTYQGFYQMAGSFGRMIAPLLMSATYTFFGPRIPWFILIGNFVVVIAAWIVLRKKMVPFDEYEANRVRCSVADTNV
ncbi:hypothetical protein L5515_007511 [Caenorhabditis briggsae]|uniref:Major facilitator superfamily (MFS) profile domain-containing protein n=1 Tax=Caenorhabditis briggsae TaxID=6238 RepID=A0AAE9F5B9_CAEBR|nr:hypothetical protein L5515_007511 [Caenorhabditis briggsae]